MPGQVRALIIQHSTVHLSVPCIKCLVFPVIDYSSLFPDGESPLTILTSSPFSYANKLFCVPLAAFHECEKEAIKHCLFPTGKVGLNLKKVILIRFISRQGVSFPHTGTLLIQPESKSDSAPNW